MCLSWKLLKSNVIESLKAWYSRVYHANDGRRALSGLSAQSHTLLIILCYLLFITHNPSIHTMAGSICCLLWALGTASFCNTQQTNKRCGWKVFAEVSILQQNSFSNLFVILFLFSPSCFYLQLIPPFLYSLLCMFSSFISRTLTPTWDCECFANEMRNNWAANVL